MNALPAATTPSQAPGGSTSTRLIGFAARNARTIAQRGPYSCASASSDPGGTSIGYCRSRHGAPSHSSSGTVIGTSASAPSTVNRPSATSAVIFMPTHMPDARDSAMP